MEYGEVVRVGERYFSVIATRGTLAFLWGSGVAPWDAKELFYFDEAIVEHILASAKTGRRRWKEEKVETAGELSQVLESSQRSESHIRVWVREGLEEPVKQLMD